MSLTPEQFNKLATKEDLNKVKQDLSEFQKTTLDSLDKISKKLDDIRS